jgi:hypothetical protein
MNEAGMRKEEIPNEYRQYVYIFDNGQLVKIGMSKNPSQRIRSLETQSGFICKTKWISPCLKKAREFERHLHEEFSSYRVVGEYFSVSFERAVSFAEAEVKDFSMTRGHLTELEEASVRSSDEAKITLESIFGCCGKQKVDEHLLKRAIFDSRASASVRRALLDYVFNEHGACCDYVDDIPSDLFDDAVVFWLLKHSMLMDGIALKASADLCNMVDEELRDEIRRTIAEETAKEDEDYQNNYPRYIELANERAKPRGEDKT